jgi:Cu-Zn family superoxide dismutase
MRLPTVVFSGCLVVTALGCRSAGAQTAQAELRDSEGGRVATAALAQVEEGVNISLEALKLPPGTHGFHIHAAGRCEPPDFSSAGPHFNPHGRKHGLKNPEGAHGGDLPNFVVGLDGTGRLELVAKEVTLGEGLNSLFHPEGTALVIHASADDEVTDPAGNAGARIACGVIEKKS